MRVCYSKMHGCNDIPLVRTIFSQEERSSYMRASLYIFAHYSTYPRSLHEEIYQKRPRRGRGQKIADVIFGWPIRVLRRGVRARASVIHVIRG